VLHVRLLLLHSHRGVHLAAPIIPIALLVATPGKLQTHNMVFVLPSIIYTTLIFPMWHKSPYGWRRGRPG